jgi:hypothetical protein
MKSVKNDHRLDWRHWACLVAGVGAAVLAIYLSLAAAKPPARHIHIFVDRPPVDVIDFSCEAKSHDE